MEQFGTSFMATTQSWTEFEPHHYFRITTLKLPHKPLLHYATAVPQSQVESTLNQLRQNLTEPDTLAEAKSLSQQFPLLPFPFYLSPFPFNRTVLEVWCVRRWTFSRY